MEQGAHGAPPLLGRDREAAALRDALGAGDCPGVVVYGPAGIGKTRLANHALAVAADEGLAVASIRATRPVADIPYAGLGQLFTTLGIDVAPEDHLLGGVGSAIDRHRGDRRMVLGVDDAQDLDEASTTLLHQLLDRDGLTMVFTVRTAEPGLGSAITPEPTMTGPELLWQRDRVRRVPLGPLQPDTLGALVAGVLDDPVDGATRQQLIRASAGNPLLLHELIDGAQESGALIHDLGLWRLTASLASQPLLRDLIGQRLAGLDPTERETLELVALADPVDLRLLERVVSLEALEALEQRGLVVARSGSAGLEVRLSHPLHGEVVRADLPGLRQARLCRALATAAEADGTAHGPRALRIAVWQLDGGTIGTTDSVIAAARSALRSSDHLLALRLARAAWERWRDPDAALLVGDALDFLGRGREALDVLAEASALATTDRQRTVLAVRRAAVLFRTLGDADGAGDVMAVAAATVTDPACRRELESARGDHLLLGGHVGRAIAVITPILEHPADDAAFAQSSMDYCTALAMAGRTKEALEHIRGALEVRRNLDDEEQLSALGVYLVAQSLAHLHTGDLADAAALGDAGYQVSLERHNVDGQAWFASILGLVRMAQGRPASSLVMFREAAAAFRTLHHPGQAWGLGGIALAGAHLGQAPVGVEAIADLDALDAATPRTVHLQDVGVARGRAWTAIAAGELSRGRQLLWDAADLGEEWGQLSATAEALHDLVRLGRTPPATERLSDLGRRVDGAFIAARVIHADAVQTRSQELAAEAADRFEAIGAMLFAAEAASLESQLATGSGLHRRAAAASARAEALLSGCEGARTPALGHGVLPSRLTPREHEVGLLAAQGLSSREIGERLFVSTRTVDNHLQRIFAKLGINGRPELAAHLGGEPEPA